MPRRIEDYALIGDCETAALVGCDGSIDWFPVPRFDSGACFAALLGSEEHGRWLIAPNDGRCSVKRRYRDGTLVLETDFETGTGSVRIVDFMPLRDGRVDIVRIVVGLEGQVDLRMELVIRFDYGSTVPWVRKRNGGITAVAGPEALYLDTSVPCRGQNFRTVADFKVSKGERRPFVLTWAPSVAERPSPQDPEAALRDTERFWCEWTRRGSYEGPWREAVQRSLITLKALTYAPTGGLVAAATTSLPERIGGERNWDYRYCWLRDATFSLYALLIGGYVEEARAWREWLIRAVAGRPGETQIMYGLGGERRLSEAVLDWLPGYEHSKPVRIGNAAAEQHQLDVYGEVMDALYLARRHGIEASENASRIQRSLMEFLEKDWKNPDHGIWEVRGPKQHFVHSKIMAWVAVDRSIRLIERFGAKGPLERWRALRATIFDDVCTKGYDAERGAFVQAYGSEHLDASLLMIPLVGFLPPTDERVRGTVAAIRRELTRDGLVQRYHTSTNVDGLSVGEGTFLICSFWLADNLALMGDVDEGAALFERLLSLRNDVGLLSEQYDPVDKRFLGNFPQAFSHVSLVNTARALLRAQNPAADRGACRSHD
jgi:GH15 family glucan-1,4-alpha-glucosidase